MGPFAEGAGEFGTKRVRRPFLGHLPQTLIDLKSIKE